MTSESLEIKAIRKYLTDSGVKHVVTFTNTGKHVANSYHFREGTLGLGLAVDIGLNPAQPNSPALRAIYDALHAQKSQLAELIYAGSGLSTNIKNGREVSIYDHAPDASNHVHVAVEKGTFLVWQSTTKEEAMAKYGIVPGLISEVPNGKPDAKGRRPFVGMSQDGGVFTLNGAPYQGGPKDIGVNRNDWVGIVVHIDGSYTCYADEVQRDEDGSYRAPTFSFPVK